MSVLPLALKPAHSELAEVFLHNVVRWLLVKLSKSME